MKEGSVSFPEWAPAELVIEYRKLKPCESTLVDDDALLLRDFCRIGMAIEAERADRLENILLRLLTHHDMKKVWAALSRPAKAGLSNRYVAIRGYLLWDMIKRAFRDFEEMSPTAQTGAENRKSLLAIVEKTKALQEAIAKHSIASRYSRRIVELHLSTQHIERQHELGGLVSWAEWQVPGLTLSGDLDEARRAIDDEHEDTEKSWSKRPLTERLALWACDANETTLDDLLNLLSDGLQSEAQKDQEIKQPGRGEDAFKPFLVRRLSEYMEWFYGQPLSDVVAVLATIILDLDPPLTRNDIRPYIRSTGKKPAKNH